MTNARVSTAAAAAAVVPFHCVICFDEFNQTVKFPVVLPCGHTYVCSPCAKRIKRCMECRQPLFWTPPSPSPAVSAPPTQQYYVRHHYRSSRYHPPPSPPQAQHAPSGAVSPSLSEPIRYPLPKNLVLLAMMQAAEHHRVEDEKENKNVHMKTLGEGEEEEKSNQDDSSNMEDDEDELDLNQVISGMVTFSGPCGTYAVRDPNGLAVLPVRKSKDCREDESAKQKDPDSRKGAVVVQDSENDTEESSEVVLNDQAATKQTHEPFTIMEGQTVQVVNFENGVAKLAHGMGYIMASSSQLVKVGGPLARTCRLEGMADTLSLRGKDLKSALDEHNEIEARVRRRIEIEMTASPTYPIIADALVVDEEEQQVEEFQRSRTPEDETPVTDSPRTPITQKESTPANKADCRTSSDCAETADGHAVPENRLTVYNGSGNADTTFPRSPNSIDNADLSNRAIAPEPAGIPSGMPRYRRNSEDDLNSYTYGCDFALIGQGFLNFENENQLVGRRSFDALEDVPESNSSTPNNNTTTTTPASTTAPEFPVTPPGSVRRPAVAGGSAGTTPQTPVSSLMSAASPILSSSFDAAVDFRTGLSGHRGLSKASTRSTRVRTANVRMMSEHRGIFTGYSHS